MSARATLLNFAKRAAKAPVRVTRRNMSGGGTIEEERGAHARRAPTLTPQMGGHVRVIPGYFRVPAGVRARVDGSGVDARVLS